MKAKYSAAAAAAIGEVMTMMRRHAFGMESTCIYDELFVTDGSTQGAQRAVAIFEYMCLYVIESYEQYLSKADLERLENLQQNGSPILKLVFILALITHDAAIRLTFENECEVPADFEKMKAYYRALAIGFRSLYQSPFDANNIQMLILSLLGFLHRAWACTNTELCHNLCSAYGMRCPEDQEVEDSAKNVANWIASSSKEELIRHQSKIAEAAAAAAKRDTTTSEGGGKRTYLETEGR
jgi:hypothetical protein